MQIQDAKCVITGASTGIGFAVARLLGAKAAKLVVCARDEGRLSDAVSRLEAEGADVTGTKCDVANEQSVQTFAGIAAERLGHVDVLINNAGIGHFAPLTDLTVSQYDDIMNVNVRGVFLATKAFLPGMLERKAGHIVNVASLAGKNGFEGGTAYAASKHAVLGLSKSLMLEVRKLGVRVLAVCPGSVDTPFFDKAGVGVNNLDQVLKSEDVADAIVSALELPDRALISELDIRPANP
jgi:short-subunit dehydrogenase